MEKLKLFFDDERIAPEGWLTIRPCEIQNFVNDLIEFPDFRDKVEAISFDHDLGLDYPDGYVFFCQLEEAYYINEIIPPMLYVHSMNSAGRERLFRGIESLNRKIGRSYNCGVLPE